MSNFVDEVEKEITTEASPDSWHHPGPGDVVTAELETCEGDADSVVCETCTWAVGAGVPRLVAGADLDRCVRTMRRGECATVRAKGAQASVKPATLHLRAIERREDLLGDGRLLRVTIQDGTGWATPEEGMELRVRFAWRAVAAATPVALAAAELSGRAGGGPDAGGGPSEGDEAITTTVFLGGPADEQAEAAASREMVDLRRALLSRLGGTVAVRADPGEAPPAAAAKGPIVRIVRGGSGGGAAEILYSGGPEGLSAAAAREALQATPSGPELPWRDAREVAMSVEEHLRIRCSAEDWIPGVVGMKVLADMRAGQRCTVRVAPELAFGMKGLSELGVPPNAELEYDVELLQIMKLEDVSLDGSRGMMKKTIRDGEGYDRPTEGTSVTVRLEARDDASGAVLVEEREVEFQAASGRLCLAVDETVLTMKRGQACEIRCTDTAACTDEELGLRPDNGAAVVLSLELLDFQKVDLYGNNEADSVAYCTKRKEVGTRFFQEGNCRRAAKRYKFVTTTLAYLDHWKDAAAKDEAAALRRVCHLNLAACCLKYGAWRDADLACGTVLGEDPENVKALFRRGQALKELGDYREAEQCVRKVLEIDKDNKEAMRLLVKLRQFLKQENEQKKEMLSRMAQGIGAGAGPAAGPGVGAGDRGGEGGGGAGSHEEEGCQLALRPSPWSSAWPWGVVAALAFSGIGLFFARRWHK